MENKKGIGNWPSPRGAGVNCPPAAKLAEWMRDSGSDEARAHLADCETCAATAKTVREAALQAGGDMNAFMQKVRQSAQLEAEQHSSPWTFVVNYFSASHAQTFGAFAAVATALLIVTSLVWRHLGIFQPDRQVQTINFDRDLNGESYREAMGEIEKAYAATREGRASRTSAAAEIDQLNQTLAKVDESKLQPEQKQQLEALKGQYQALVFDRFQPSLSSSAGGTKSRSLQTDFFSTYADYLARDGEQLSVSPQVNVKPSKGGLYVIGQSDVSGSREAAATKAVRDLQSRLPQMTLEYKSAPVSAAAASQSSASSHPD